MKTPLNPAAGLAAVLLSGLLSVQAMARTFTNQKGQKIEAVIQSADGDKVTLILAGKSYTLEITSFVEADQKFIREWEKEASKPIKPAQAADDRVLPGASLKLAFPDLTVDRNGKPAEVNLRIPENYDASKPVPFIAWMGGGDGGNSYGGCTALVDQKEFVMAGLPFPKDANNPAQANMVGEYDKIWDFHEAMFAEIEKVIPNLDPRLRIIAGFSNGAHTIDGILSEVSGGYREFFTVYVLIEGGNGNGRYSKVTDRHLYVAWGTTGKNNAAGSEEVAKKARRARMEVVKHEMEGVGHAFPESEKKLVSEWLAKTVLPSIRGMAAAE